MLLGPLIIVSPTNTVDCGPPTPADSVIVEPPVSSTTAGSTFSFRCAEGLFPDTTHEAVCGADGQWRPDPANHSCVNAITGTAMHVHVVVSSI